MFIPPKFLLEYLLPLRRGKKCNIFLTFLKKIRNLRSDGIEKADEVVYPVSSDALEFTLRFNYPNFRFDCICSL
jgi:hypothetical protein